MSIEEAQERMSELEDRTKETAHNREEIEKKRTEPQATVGL